MKRTELDVREVHAENSSPVSCRLLSVAPLSLLLLDGGVGSNCHQIIFPEMKTSGNDSPAPACLVTPLQLPLPLLLQQVWGLIYESPLFGSQDCIHPFGFGLLPRQQLPRGLLVLIAVSQSSRGSDHQRRQISPWKLSFLDLSSASPS